VAKNDLISRFELAYCQDLLKQNEWNISKAARQAAIERAYLQRLIRKYGLKAPNA
jgi:DNA-binding NtrC family response regulator